MKRQQAHQPQPATLRPSAAEILALFTLWAAIVAALIAGSTSAS